jgi:hypothetical protein
MTVLPNGYVQLKASLLLISNLTAEDLLAVCDGVCRCYVSSSRNIVVVWFVYHWLRLITGCIAVCQYLLPFVITARIQHCCPAGRPTETNRAQASNSQQDHLMLAQRL